ncbi:hypothetical protein REPUB_Repub16aG0144600 [Reevesia pubescens]
MSSERLITGDVMRSDDHQTMQNSTATTNLAWSGSFRQCGENDSIFEELPKATIVSVSRPDTGDMSPMLLSYTIEVQYKQALPLRLFLYCYAFQYRGWPFLQHLDN